MSRRFLFAGLAALPAAAVIVQIFAAQPAPRAAAKLSFNEAVQPILADNCYSCHGIDAGSRKAELRLDRFEFATAKRKDGGPAIVPGKPDDSPLIQRLETKDEKKIMPPPESHKTLKPEQIALLRRWVAEGAEYEEHWAFIPPRRPPVPGSSAQPSALSSQLPPHPVDAFIRARLAREGLAPAPEADRRTLIRRAALDLTGVIPTAEETEAFVADRAPDAYEKLVDRLLADPRFGEHRARYWLDYARYADTHGIHFDNYR